MMILRDYEKKVLRLLLSAVLSTDEINNIIRDGELVSYEYTGNGYFVGLSHPQLSKNRIVCSKPIVIGEEENIVCGFVLFIENSKLIIECHSWNEANIPEDFRNKDVQVRAVKIEEGNFIGLETES